MRWSWFLHRGREAGEASGHSNARCHFAAAQLPGDLSEGELVTDSEANSSGLGGRQGLDGRSERSSKRLEINELLHSLKVACVQLNPPDAQLAAGARFDPLASDEPAELTIRDL